MNMSKLERAKSCVAVIPIPQSREKNSNCFGRSNSKENLRVSDGLEFRLQAARWQIATSSRGPAKAGTPNMITADSLSRRRAWCRRI